MKTIIKISAIAIGIMSLVGCNQEQQTENEVVQKDVKIEESVPEPVSHVMTKEDQSVLTPEGIIKSFKDGNSRFMNDELTPRSKSLLVSKSAFGQFPEAVILSCLDSRVPVEQVFDKGIGDLFVARIAGNFVNEDILGSMEFACKVSGAKLVLVLGHHRCGAISAAVDDVKLGNITTMLDKIKPAVALVNYDGDRTSSNSEFVAMACESNVINTINEIRKNSPILKELEDNGKIKIVGAVYNVENGKVDWLN